MPSLGKNPRLVWLFGVLIFLIVKGLKMFWMAPHYGPSQEGDEKGVVHTWRVEISYNMEHLLTSANKLQSFQGHFLASFVYINLKKSCKSMEMKLHKNFNTRPVFVTSVT